MNILNKNKKGLTLIETLIAITILLTSTVMPLVIYSRSIENSRYANDTITATYLAQGAVELIKYDIYTELNNNYVKSKNNWFEALPNCDGVGANVCSITIPSGVVCRGNSCDSNLYINSNNLYTHSPTLIQSKFSRTVKFPNSRPKYGTPISSTVKWKSGNKSKSVTVKEYVTKWR